MNYVVRVRKINYLPTSSKVPADSQPASSISVDQISENIDEYISEVRFGEIFMTVYLLIVNSGNLGSGTIFTPNLNSSNDECPL